MGPVERADRPGDTGEEIRSEGARTRFGMAQHRIDEPEVTNVQV
jgi:hypothetical protein